MSDKDKKWKFLSSPSWALRKQEKKYVWLQSQIFSQFEGMNE